MKLDPGTHLSSNPDLKYSKGKGSQLKEICPGAGPTNDRGRGKTPRVYNEVKTTPNVPGVLTPHGVEERSS